MEQTGAVVLDLLRRDGELVIRAAAVGEEIGEYRGVFIFDAGGTVIGRDSSAAAEDLCAAPATDVVRLA